MHGLSTTEALARLHAHGPNRLPEPPPQSVMRIFLGQLHNPLVLALLGAAVIAVLVGATGERSSFLGRYGDALAIVLIVLINAGIGTYQERRAEEAIGALRRLEVPRARVVRDGARAMLPAEELVPGDLVELEAGDAVPADARLVEGGEVSVEEAALTGESVPVVRRAGEAGEDLVHLGTTIVRGKASAVVAATGVATELGRIGRLIESAGGTETPLERRMRVFGQRVLWVCIGVSVLLFAWGLARGGRAWHEELLGAVSFAVAAIPESLPAITAITLALGMQRMARRGALVRRLPAVETLGSTTVVCSDKTGTLTRNEMTVREVWVDGRRHQVQGEGYAAGGRIAPEDGPASAPTGPLAELLLSGALCNGAHLAWRDGARVVVGDPTEGALLVLAERGGLAHQAIRAAHPVERELPFDAARRRMMVVVGGVAHVKGAVDVVLARSTRQAVAAGVRPLDEGDRATVLAETERMSSRGLRVLALARRDLGPDDDPESDLTFLGVVGMADPPRSGVKEAIAACAEAGVRVAMVTGDHPLTAKAIAGELGLWRPGDEVLTGAELEALSDEALRSRAPRVRIFARTTPEHKLRIVRALQAAGEVVAMTGDGVNDAPALAEAHIGVAMGRGGTDVARRAADMVLTDDNFATLVEAIREGRAIYRNIQKAIFFLLSSNAGLAVAVFGTSLLGRSLPLTPLMILWINLVTNGLPALALGMDPTSDAVMRERPRSTGAELLALRDYLGLAFVGVVMGALALLAQHLGVRAGAPEGGRTLAFTILALSPLAHAWSCRSPTASIFTIRPRLSWWLVGACAASAGIHLLSLVVPPLRAVFQTTALDASGWGAALLGAAAVVGAVELAKAVGRLVQAHRRAGMEPAPLGGHPDQEEARAPR